jgi:hypothetical protein
MWLALLIAFMLIMILAPYAFLGSAALLDRRPEWLDTAVALGTIAAATFAGGAAAVAAWSAKATRDLVEIERARDRRLTEELRERQAKSTFFDLRYEPYQGRHRGLQVYIQNAGLEPVRQCRVLVSCDGRTWGPISAGTLAPNDILNVVFSLDFFNADPAFDFVGLEASVSFTDIRGQRWLLAREGGPVEMSTELVDSWSAQARDWELQSLSQPNPLFMGQSGPASQGDAIIAYQAERDRQLRR